MNVELLRKIATVIQEKPEQFDMADWVGENTCGTTYCLAGWACVLSGIPECEICSSRAKEVLQIKEGYHLFYPDMWPRQFQGGEDGWSPTPEQAAARIEHFIATDGAE